MTTPSPLLRLTHISRHIRLRPRLATSAALGIGLMLVLHWLTDWRLITRLLFSWDVACGLYLLLAWTMMLRSSHERMRQRARRQDDGAAVVLGLSICAALASLAAILVELATVKDVESSLRTPHVVGAGLTILLAWTFIHTTFALHYANIFYADEGACRIGGLDFPGREPPDYLDFLYFSFVIGTSGQTADISLTSRRMRRLGLLHCTLAFLFNTTILALTVNIGASLLG